MGSALSASYSPADSTFGNCHSFQFLLNLTHYSFVMPPLLSQRFYLVFQLLQQLYEFSILHSIHQFQLILQWPDLPHHFLLLQPELLLQMADRFLVNAYLLFQGLYLLLLQSVCARRSCEMRPVVYVALFLLRCLTKLSGVFLFWNFVVAVTPPCILKHLVNLQLQLDHFFLSERELLLQPDILLL